MLTCDGCCAVLYVDCRVLIDVPLGALRVCCSSLAVDNWLLLLVVDACRLLFVVR